MSWCWSMLRYGTREHEVVMQAAGAMGGSVDKMQNMIAEMSQSREVSPSTTLNVYSPIIRTLGSLHLFLCLYIHYRTVSPPSQPPLPSPLPLSLPFLHFPPSCLP